MERKKNLVKELRVESIDYETGEVKEQKSYSQQKIDTEPDYIKLYIADMSRWADLQQSTSTVLGAVLRYMTYDNKIVLNSFIKGVIAANLGTTKGNIDVQLNRLCKKGLLARIGYGTYMANPYTFGRGKWTETKEIRATVTYNSDGVSFSIVTNPPKQLSIPGMPEFSDPFERFLEEVGRSSKKEE